MSNRSTAIFGDEKTRQLLINLGFSFGSDHEVDVEEFFEECRSDVLGFRCLEASLAVYMSNEHVFRHAAGQMLLEAAGQRGVELCFDLDAGGLTRAMAEKLLAACHDRSLIRLRAFSSGEETSSFHSKVISFCLQTPIGRVVISLVGSANFTLGGLRRNHELGTLVCRQVDDAGDVYSTGSTALDAALSRYQSEFPLVTDLEVLPESAESQTIRQAHRMLASGAELRDYQVAAADALVQSFQHRRVASKRGWRGAMLVLPPAAGKTRIALSAALRLLSGKAERVSNIIWVSPEPGLARQAFEELRSVLVWAVQTRVVEAFLLEGGSVHIAPEYGAWSIKPSVFLRQIADDQELETGRILFVGKDRLASLNKKVNLEGWADLVIVDEAHHAIAPEWDRLLRQLSPRCVFGLTATPFRSTLHNPSTKTLLNAFSLGSADWLDYFPKARRSEAEKALPQRGGGGNLAYVRSIGEFIQEDRNRSPSERVLAEPMFEIVKVIDEDGGILKVCPHGSGRLPPHRRLEKTLTILEDAAVGSLRSAEDIARHRAKGLLHRVDDPKRFAAALGRIDGDALNWAIERMKEQLVVVFARGTGHAELLAKQAEWLGVKRDPGDMLVVHSKDGRTPGWRRFLVRQLSRKGRGLLICVDMLSEGTDLRKASALVITRWTTSERMYWQLVGRGLRGVGSGGTESASIRLYEVIFTNENDDQPVFMRHGSNAVLDEMKGVGVAVSEESMNLKYRTSTKGRVKVSRVKTRTAAKSRSQVRWQGYMYVESVDRLKQVPSGEYMCSIKRVGGGVVWESVRSCSNPYKVIAAKKERFTGGKYRFTVRMV